MLSQLKLLVVDDEAVILKLIDAFLTKEGYHCTTTISGEQALGLLQEQSFDIILTDLSMAGVDGLELVRQAKLLSPQTICVLMSGLGTRLDVIAAMQMGVFDFLEKPFGDLDVLSAVMQRAAASRRLTIERDALLEDLKRQNARLETSLARLNTAYGQLRSQEATLASDLRQSQRMQRKLLPASFPKLAGFDLFGYFGPCERLGGDFFGAIPLADGRLAIYLLDVAGHGVSAAMVTVIFRELLQPRRLLPARDDILGRPDEALSYLNQALLEEAFDPPILVTMLYAVLDPQKGEMEVASAGHPPPFVVNEWAVARPLAVNGPVLGLQSPSRYTTAVLKLNPGDSVLIYSDGVSEARASVGAAYTPLQLSLAFATLHGTSAVQTGHAIERAVRHHLEDRVPLDDMTFIVINRTAEKHSENGSRDSASGLSAQENVRVVLPPREDQPVHAMQENVSAGWHGATCVIHFKGLLTWQAAPVMRELIAKARTEGNGMIRVDLAECEALDSAMLGLLYQYSRDLQLHQPCERVRDQFQEMGILERLQIDPAPAPSADRPMTVTHQTTRAACSELILSAHQALMEASEENKRRFQDVVSSLAPLPNPKAGVEPPMLATH